MANLPALTSVLDPNVLYFGDNGRCHCGRLECAGMQAFASGVALDGQPCVPLTEAARLEPFDVSRFACEHCKRKLCPSCGALMTKERGAVSEEVIATGVNVKKRVARPATFYACGACEHCEEV